MLKPKTVFFAVIITLVLTACVNIAQSVIAKGELVVLSHGLGRSDSAMWRLEDKLEQAGFEVCSIDYDTIGESVTQVLNQANKEITNCLSNVKNNPANKKSWTDDDQALFEKISHEILALLTKN